MFTNDMKLMTTELDAAIKTAVEDFTEQLNDLGEVSIEGTVEDVPTEAESGFIPFTDGGYSALAIYFGSLDTSHVPNVLQDYMLRMQKQAEHDFFYEQHDEFGSDDEVAEYLDRLRGDTMDSDEWYEYTEWESEYMLDCSPAVSAEVLYYSADNPHNPSNVECLLLQVATNTDAPYYRMSKGVNVFKAVIAIDADTEAHLLAALDTALEAL